MLYSKTPETYLGYSRLANLTSSEQISADIKTTYNAPEKLEYNAFALDGDWTINQTYAVPQKNASLFYHVDAKDVYLLMKPEAGEPTVKILVDNKIQFEGVDVKDGKVTVDKSRLYHIAHFDTPGEHVVTIQFLDGNVQVYTFTFG